MVNLNKTKWGVYYFHDYENEKKRAGYNQQDVQISEQIIDYKNDDGNAMEIFTDELMQVISYLSNNVMGSNVKNLALVAVPPSKVEKYCPMKKSINLIKRWYEKGITESE